MRSEGGQFLADDSARQRALWLRQARYRRDWITSTEAALPAAGMVAHTREEPGRERAEADAACRSLATVQTAIEAGVSARLQQTIHEGRRRVGLQRRADEAPAATAPSARKGAT
jgi:hypothetical protein